MQTLHFHPKSLLLGLAIGVGFVALTSQTSTVTFPSQRVEVGPHPRDMVQILVGTPYTVPPGKIFVLTALGAHHPAVGVALKVNSTTVLNANTTGAGDTGMQEVPRGFTVLWGNTIEVVCSQSTGMAWGYVAER